MVANGAAVGATAAVVGAGVGLAGWLAFAPRLETLAEHRINRFDLPWWAVGTAMALAFMTAVLAAWWPARSASRISVVAALSGRPPRPQPARRFAVLGGVLGASGLVLLGLAHQKRPPFIITGTLATAVGVLLLAPLAISALAALGRGAPIAIRLALRDLARYQARSGAALGAVVLAVGIAATIAISAAAQASLNAAGPGNLPSNELLVYLSAGGKGGLLPELTAPQIQAAQTRAGDIAAALGTNNVLRLDSAINPAEQNLPGLGNGQGGHEPALLARMTPEGGGGARQGFSLTGVAMLYVATPELLTRYGIKADQVDPTVDLLSSRTDLAGLAIGYGPDYLSQPKIQSVNLPRYTADPNTLITMHAVQALGLELRPAGWLVQAPKPLTSAQINNARQLAASAGLIIEPRSAERSLNQIGNEATATGLLLALGVLAMTVGLIRSETANDLRVLAATGASSTTRRTLTGATAGALALLGALLGSAGAYLSLLAWHRSNLHPLTHAPILDVAVIIVGLPIAAASAGWLLAGREPAAIARQPLE
jgi:putative ABC transport system permease protein